MSLKKSYGKRTLVTAFALYALLSNGCHDKLFKNDSSSSTGTGAERPYSMIVSLIDYPEDFVIVLTGTTREDLDNQFKVLKIERDANDRSSGTLNVVGASRARSRSRSPSSERSEGPLDDSWISGWDSHPVKVDIDAEIQRFAGKRGDGGFKTFDDVKLILADRVPEDAAKYYRLGHSGASDSDEPFEPFKYGSAAARIAHQYGDQPTWQAFKKMVLRDLSPYFNSVSEADSPKFADGIPATHMIEHLLDSALVRRELFARGLGEGESFGKKPPPRLDRYRSIQYQDVFEQKGPPLVTQVMGHKYKPMAALIKSREDKDRSPLSFTDEETKVSYVLTENYWGQSFAHKYVPEAYEAIQVRSTKLLDNLRKKGSDKLSEGEFLENMAELYWLQTNLQPAIAISYFLNDVLTPLIYDFQGKTPPPYHRLRLNGGVDHIEPMDSDGVDTVDGATRLIVDALSMPLERFKTNFKSATLMAERVPAAP